MKIAKKIERIQWCFLWGDDKGRMRYYLVNWEEVKKPVGRRGFSDGDEYISTWKMNLDVQEEGGEIVEESCGSSLGEFGRWWFLGCNG